MKPEMECSSCGKHWPVDRFRFDGDDCFRCRIQGVGFAFAGGKEIFHNQTDKEGQDRTIAMSKANGYDVVPATTTYAGPGKL